MILSQDFSDFFDNHLCLAWCWSGCSQATVLLYTFPDNISQQLLLQLFMTKDVSILIFLTQPRLLLPVTHGDRHL